MRIAVAVEREMVSAGEDRDLEIKMHDAPSALCDTVPTTMAGAVALLTYAAERFYRHGRRLRGRP
jgi:hypothetical protein